MKLDNYLNEKNMTMENLSDIFKWSRKHIKVK